MKKLNNKKGFTLIELVVVIVILGVLVMLVVPRVSSYRDQAEKATCQANQRTIEQQQAIYALDHGGVGTSDLDDLVTAKLITAKPKCPKGGTYKPNDTDNFIWICDYNTNAHAR